MTFLGSRITNIAATLALVAFLAWFVSVQAARLRPPEPDPDGPLVLRVWESYNNEEHQVFLRLMRRFEEQFSSRGGRALCLEIGRVPFDGLLPKLKTACQTGTTPDICRVDVAHVVTLAYGQALVPLDTLPSFGGRSIEDVRAEMVEAAFDSNVVPIKQADGTWKTHLYGLPDQTSCVCLYYNRKLFEEAGLDPDRPPRTWDEVFEMGPRLTAPAGPSPRFAFAMNNSLWWTLPFLNSYGAPFVERTPEGDVKCVLDGPQAVEGFSKKVSLYRRRFEIDGVQTPIEAGAWIPGAIDPAQGFVNQRYAMIFSGPWHLEMFKNAGLDFGVARVPEGPVGSSSTVGGTNFVVFKRARDPDVALQVLQYITSPEYQAEWSRELGQIPVRKGVIENLAMGVPPELYTFYEQLLDSRARPQIPAYDRLEEILNPQMELALRGEKTPAEALRDGVARVNAEVMSLINER